MSKQLQTSQQAYSHQSSLLLDFSGKLLQKTKWLHGKHEAGDDYWLADDGKDKGEACLGQTFGWVANERETGERKQRAARSDFDYRLLDGEAAWVCQGLHHSPPATSRLGHCHCKCPFSTIGDKWGQTPLKVNSHLHQGHKGSAILIPYTLRVIKTHPGEAGEVDRIFWDC